MKKLIFVLSLSVLAMMADAQVPGFSIGPKIGYNSNALSLDKEDITAGLKSEFQFGAFVRLGKKVYLQPEANYQVKGGILNSVSVSTNEQKIKLKTISVPVLLGFRIVNAGPFNLRLMAGPTMSFVIDKNISISGIPDAFPIKSKDDIKNSIWSLQAGGGIDLFSFTLDVRYEIGLDNMYQGSEDFSLKNNIFNVSLGFKLL